MGILFAILSALIVGSLARLFFPGKQPMPLWQTIVLGMVGGFVGGLITAALGLGNQAGLVGGIIGACLVLWAMKWLRKNGVI